MSYPSIPCTVCQFPTRKQRVTIDQAPGTLIRKGSKCYKCYDVTRPKAQKDYKKQQRERMAAEVVDVAHIRIGLDGFMAERRTRLAAKP